MGYDMYWCTSKDASEDESVMVDRAAGTTGRPAETWLKWIAFLEGAIDHDGFEVW